MRPVMMGLGGRKISRGLLSQIRSKSDVSRSKLGPDWLLVFLLLKLATAIRGRTFSYPITKFLMFDMCCYAKNPADAGDGHKMSLLQVELNVSIFGSIHIPNVPMSLPPHSSTSMIQIWQYIEKLDGPVLLGRDVNQKVTMVKVIQYSADFAPFLHCFVIHGVEIY